MKRALRLLALGCLLLTVGASSALGQFTVRDPAIIARNRVTAGLQQLTAAAQRLQREQLLRMSRRLGAFTNLIKYAVQETPEWRIHDFWTEAVFFARAYHAALNYGDRSGSAYEALTIPIVAPTGGGVPGVLTEAGRREWTARLATVEATDAVAMSSTHDAGVLRYNGRREQEAIEGLQAHVVDPSDEQSATAILDKLSGSVLIASRQRQARSQFIGGIVEQLVLETKRARDTESTAINMQLTTWRDGASAGRALAHGTGSALSSWRQP